MVYLHFAIAGILFTFGLIMRFGLGNKLVAFGYRHIPKYKRVAFDEFDVRYFMGETSIKLGMILLMIAIVGLVSPDKLKQALIIGWTCFIIYAVLSVTFIDKLDIFEKRRREKRKEKYEKALARLTPYSGHADKTPDTTEADAKPTRTNNKNPIYKATEGDESDDYDTNRTADAN